MKTFKCDCSVAPTLFFESNLCNVCGRLVGITDEYQSVMPFDLDSSSGHYTLKTQPKNLYKKCKNSSDFNVCNGMVSVHLKDPKGLPLDYCFACRFNNIIPNLNVAEHLKLWQKMETAKRRALFTLNKLPLPLLNIDENPSSGLVFNFCVDADAKDHFATALPDKEQVMTGHDCGNITINLAEADDVARSKIKVDMGERYRTLLGHFRHELGHYYFDQLIANNVEKSNECKKIFGDHEQSYEDSLTRHYEQGAPLDWRENFISEYATMHPWEDWAETWAHYMHITDSLETLDNFGIVLPSNKKRAPKKVTHKAVTDPDYFTGLLDTWMEFSVILNSLNRSMGLQDAYPFVLSLPVRQKLSFIHHAIFNQ